jgi:hypothetical protein
MHLFKQALIQYKTHWQESLLIGLFSFVCVLAAPSIPIVGSFFLSLVLLSFQLVIWFRLENKRWPIKNDLFPQTVIPLLVCSLVMTPTSILIGSAHGLLASPQDLLTSWLLSIGLLFVGLYFYFLIAHALLLTRATNLGIAKALDRAALETMRNFRLFAPLCLIFAILFLISQATLGAGWVLALPLLYYTGSFSLKK